MNKSRIRTWSRQLRLEALESRRLFTADLQLSSLHLVESSIPSAGQPTQIEIEVRNTGDAPCRSYVEVDVTRWQSTIPEWVGVVDFNLGPGQMLTAVPRNAKKPSDPFWRPQQAGIYIVSAIADPPYAAHPRGDVIEISEDNNSAYLAVQVGLPDFIVSGLQGSPPVAIPGQQAQIEFDISNEGDGPWQSYVEVEVTPWGSATPEWTGPVNFDLGHGETVHAVVTDWRPQHAGIYVVSATADPPYAGHPRGDLLEADEDNNRAFLSVQVGLPDFQIVSQPRIVSPLVPSPSRQALGDQSLLGHETQIQIEVRNNGDGPCKSYVEVEATYWGESEPEWVGVVTFDLGHGETLTAVAKDPTNQADPFWTPNRVGPYIVSATADPPYADHPRGDVLEATEDNNSWYSAVHVHAQLPAATGQPTDWLRSMLTPDQNPNGGGGSLVTSYLPTDHIPSPTLTTLRDRPLHDLETVEWIASSYDNALAVIALSATGVPADIAKAVSILTELEYLQDSQGAFSFAWYAPLPKEHVEAAARTVGNNAWIVLAVCRYTEQTGDARFVNMAENTANWMLQRQDPTTGLLKGGLDENGNPIPWTSTEHNVDAVGALESLAELVPTQKARYLDAADAIRHGIATYLWIDSEGRFRRGLNDDYPVSDAQSWAVLSLGAIGPNGEEYRRALDWAVTNFSFVDDLYVPPVTGVDFNCDQTENLCHADTISPEQTESLALAWLSVGDSKKYQAYHAEMTRLSNTGGGVRYTSRPGTVDESVDRDGNKSVTITLESVAGTAWWLFSDGRKEPFHVADTIAPSVTIAPPSEFLTAGDAITYNVTYADDNLNASTLSAADVTLNRTGSAAGNVSVEGSGMHRTVRISDITGDGTLGISIAAGTASDRAGNLAPATGPSATFVVDNTAPTATIGVPSAPFTAGGPITYMVS